MSKQLDVDEQEQWEETAWSELPQAEVIAPHVMLDEFEVVNVLGESHELIELYY